MRYRVIVDGEGYATQSKRVWWPFWTDAFIHSNYFVHYNDAYHAIAKATAAYRRSSTVIKEFDENGNEIGPPMDKP